MVEAVRMDWLLITTKFSVLKIPELAQKCCVPFKKQKTFSVFPYSYRNTSGSLGEREIEVGTRADNAPKLLQVFL